MAGWNGLSIFALSLTACASLGAENGAPSVLWDTSVNLRGGIGYRDNVLLRKGPRDGSGFWQSGLDLMLFRVSTAPDAAEISFFLSAEDRRYFSAEEVSKEQLLFSQIEWDKPLLNGWRAGAVAQYVYTDQVFDASATEELLETLPVRSHNVQVTPFLGRDLPWNSRLEAKFNLERQLFGAPLDDYWEIGPQITWTKSYGYRSEVAVSYTYDHRFYDGRQQIDLDRQFLPGTSLRFSQHEFEAYVTHVWDENRHWRSRLRFVFERNDDNGPGFYDYNRFRWSKRFGYYGDRWEAVVEGKVLHYDYLRQPVDGSNEVRDVWEYAVAARVEWQVWKKLRIFAESEHEIVNSNFELEEYTVNTVLGGVDWEF